MSLDPSFLRQLIDKNNRIDRRLSIIEAQEASDLNTDIAAEIVASTEKVTPADADLFAIIDSAASNILKKITWANMKAALALIFGSLGVANTWTKSQTISSTTVDSHALGVVRNLAAASTNSAVFIASQTNAGDDQPTVSIAQYGTGDIIEAYDGVVKVFRVLSDGSLAITRNLDSAFTADPVVNIVQDSVSDDQPLLRLQQDSVGEILVLFDGATEVFSIEDGGGMMLPTIASKATPIDADGVLIRDSAASNVTKQTTWANIKATLKTYFDTLYGLLAAVNTWTRQQFIDGSANEIQLRVQANATQTANIQTWENSSAAVGSWIDSSRRFRTTAGSYLKNSYFALLGENMEDASMTGMYDRNELSNAALRGVVTVTVTGAGSYTNTVAEKNKLFDHSPGNYFTISSTDGTTTQIVIHVDMLALQPNYSSQFWQPFVQYRLTNITGFSGTWYRDITVEVSSDNVNWYKPASGEWETTDAASNAEMIPGYWVGSYGLPGIPGAQWRYARFTLADRQENAGYAFKDNVWIAEIGLRHRGASWSRHYLPISGGDAHGDVTFTADGVAASSYNTKIQQDGGAIFNEQGANVDYRIEGDTDPNAFFLDASLDAIGMGIATLLAKLHIKQLSSTGNTLRAERDLAAASTDGPVVNIIQDNASDDQAALRVQQDGTGDIAQFFDGANEVFEVRDGALTVITQPTLGSEVLRIASTATNDDPTESVYQQRAATTNATVTTLWSMAVPATTTVGIEAYVVARRTGGASGTAEDGAFYVRNVAVKNVAGTATILTGSAGSPATWENQAGWDCAFDVSAGDVRLRITGAVNNNVTWHATVRTWQVSS